MNMARAHFGVAGASLLVLSLAGCNGDDRPGNGVRTVVAGHNGPMIAQPAPFTPSIRALPAMASGAQAQQFAVSHDLAIGLLPEWVRPHFVAARDACLGEETLHCVLMEAEESESPRGATPPSAYLRVELAHDAVDTFKKMMMRPLAGEGAADLSVLRDSTQASDMARPIQDIERRLRDLEDYRKRLEALEGRADAEADDLIKIANELSQIQSRIEDLSGQKQRMEERAQLEFLSVSFESETPAEGPLSPVLDVWRRSAANLGSSAAEALSFLLASLPWLPIVLLVAGALRLLWRSMWRNLAPRGNG